MDKNKIAQIWIESVLYTIIGLSIIGIVLAFVIPKVNESKDSIIVEQSITSLKQLDSKINDVARQKGNIGRIDFNIKRGYLYINSTGDRITLVVDGLTSLYSESNVSISDGNLKILSMKGQKTNTVYLTLDYELNITFNGKDDEKKITAANLAYKLLIENKDNKIIDIRRG